MHFSTINVDPGSLEKETELASLKLMES